MLCSSDVVERLAVSGMRIVSNFVFDVKGPLFVQRLKLFSPTGCSVLASAYYWYRKGIELESDV